MQDYVSYAKAIKSARVCDLCNANDMGTSKYKDNSAVKLLAMIEDVHLKVTRSGAIMANALLTDITGTIELTVFPKTYPKYSELLKENSVVIVDGRLSVAPEEKPHLICMAITAVPKDHNKKRRGLFIRFDSSSDSRINQVYEIIKNACTPNSNGIPVYFFYGLEKKYDLRREIVGFRVAEDNISKLQSILGNENVVLQ